MAGAPSLSDLLQRRLMLAGAVSGLLLAASALWVVHATEQGGPRRLVALDQQASARHLEAAVERIEGEGRELRTLLAGEPLPTDVLRRTLEARVRHVTDLNSLQVVLLDTATATRPPSVLYVRRLGDGLESRDLADIGYDVRGRAWFEREMRATAPRWSSPFFSDAAGGIDVVNLHLPVRRVDGEPFALVSVEISVDRLRQLVAEAGQLPIRPRAAYVADREGRLLAASGDDARVAPDLPDLLRRFGLPVDLAAVGGIALSPSGFALSHQPVQRLGWSIGAIFDKRDFGVLEARPVAGLLLAGALLGLLFGWLAAALARAPLRGLEGAVSRLQALALRQRLPKALSSAPASSEEAALGEAGEALQVALLQAESRVAARDAERESARRELDVARQIQAAMLPGARVFHGRRGRLALHGELQPARAVGGDFYGFLPLAPAHCAFFLGDVSNKGIPAALFMVRVATLLGTLAGEAAEPGLMLRKASQQLRRDNHFNQSASVVVGIVDLESGEVQLASAGHAPVLLRAADGTQRWCEAAMGPPLGSPEEGGYPLLRLRLQDGDTLVAGTHGVSAALDARGRAFGAEGLQVAVERAGGKRLDRLARSILDDLRGFAGDVEPTDDLCLLLLRYEDAA